MKRFLSILLAICLCLAVLAACNAPVNNGQNPDTTLPTGSSEPTGNNGSSEPTDGNGTTDSTTSTEETLNPDGTPKGERITEAQLDTLTTNSPTNYTFCETLTYNGKTKVTTMLISGEEYLQTCEEDDTTRKIMGILRENKIKDYIFNDETGKWETSNIGISANFPLKGFPKPLSDFTYDEATGSYNLKMASGDVRMIFKNGQLVYLSIIDATAGAQDLVSFYDYGTTVIPVPNDADIVDKDNTNNSVADPDNH
ncbi:MAG: hypothetical protein E7448_02360 [Ruminococcaceae bacterium]|nr:hypothetical protein [Oscillospiraceae bacterium]